MTNSVAIVTGASQGIGRSTAVRLARDFGLKDAKGSVVLMSGNSALFPKAPYAAVGTINAAIVALAKAFSDRGITDGVQVNSVLPGPVMTGRRRSTLRMDGGEVKSI